MIKIGLIGKTNAGKTTFFNSATLLSAEISTYPFTTKKPNVGVTSVRSLCVCKELKVQDNPKNSRCVDGWRFIPIELIDLPGLITGSWRGKGLGTQFLSIAAQADALLHVVDASGSLDEEGNITKAGMGNPVIDAYDIEEELTRWFAKTVQKDLDAISRQEKKVRVDVERVLHQGLAGLKVAAEHIRRALKDGGLEGRNVSDWSEKDIFAFSKRIRELSKPTVIVANKMDLGPAEKNYERLRAEFGEAFVIPCSSQAELALRRAEQKNYIEYTPGEEVFKVIDESRLTTEQKQALAYVHGRVFSKWINTGVQFALNTCVFKCLNMNTVYPVENAEKFADKHGNVLPDVFLVPYNATVRELARAIHTELAERIIHGIDARTSLSLPADSTIRDRDIISIVAAARATKRSAS